MTINQTKGMASLIGLIAYAAGLAAVTTLIWALWNILVPAVTGWSHISWIQALGIRILVSLCSMTIKTQTEIDWDKDKKNELGDEKQSSEKFDFDFKDPFNGQESRKVTAKKDDDGGYTIRFDFTGSNEDVDEDEDDD